MRNLDLFGIGTLAFLLASTAACNKPPPEAAPATHGGGSAASAAPQQSSAARPSAAPAEPMPSVEAVCQRFASTPVPAADVASAAERAKLKGCDAEAAYYGLDTAADYERARKCALGEPGPDGAPAVDRPEVLMMLYANGQGVPVNADLALRFACQAGGAPAELGGRVTRLWAARSGAPPSAPLDQCDDATSGVMTGYCAELHERVTARTRQARLSAASAGLPPPQLAALRSAAQRFFDLRTKKELDQSGTLRSSFAIAELGKLQDDFASALERLSDRAFEPNEDPAPLERKLTAVLQRIASCPDFAPSANALPGRVERAGIDATQVRWLAYRKAFIALALAQRPSSSEGAWRAWLDQARLAQLEDLASGC